MTEVNELLGKLARVEVARLLPGDVLVVTMRDGVYLPDVVRQHFMAMWRAALPAWVKVVIVHDCDVKVVRPEDGGTQTEADGVEEAGRESG